MKSLVYHLATDIGEKCERDIGDEFGKFVKIFENGVHRNPTEKGHKRLEKRENTRYGAHSSNIHSLFVHSIGKGHGKSVHSKSDAQQDRRAEKLKIVNHYYVLRFDKKIPAHGVPYPSV